MHYNSFIYINSATQIINLSNSNISNTTLFTHAKFTPQYAKNPNLAIAKYCSMFPFSIQISPPVTTEGLARFTL